MKKIEEIFASRPLLSVDLDYSQPRWQDSLLKRRIPLNELKMTDDNDIRYINSIYRYYAPLKLFNKPFTAKGYLGTTNLVPKLPYWWSRLIVRRELITGYEFYCIFGCKLYGFKVGYIGAPESNLSGNRAFEIFRRMAREQGVDMDTYAVDKETGLKIKEEINPPLIDTINNGYMSAYPIWSLDCTLTVFPLIHHVHHLDLFQAYPSMIIAKHPELQKVFDAIRVKYPHYKAKMISNLAIGYFQSEYCQYKYAGLSKDAVNGTRDRILSLSSKMKEQGFLIIGYNTDGIFYTAKDGSDRVYQDNDLGPNEWGKYINDYIDCDFIPRGCNWIIPKGSKMGKEGFYFAMRGYYGYEAIKPRTEWTTLEDISQALNSSESILVEFNKSKGLKVTHTKLSDRTIRQGASDKDREVKSMGVTL